MDGDFRKMERNGSMMIAKFGCIVFTIGFIGQLFYSANAYGYGIMMVIGYMLYGLLNKVK